MAVLGQVATEAFPQLFITKSQTWVPPQDGTVCIHVIGGGGGGAGYPSSDAAAGAGAYLKVPSLAVTTSGSFTLVVGAGGNGGYINSGANGGNSTLAGTGLTGTKTAGGGQGGNYNNSPADGAGGQHSGSGENMVGYYGGAGGLRSGGAVGVFATGQVGGSNGTSDFRGTCRGGITDAAAGGLACSGFGIICGGSRSGNARFLQSTSEGGNLDGEDLCGGGGIHANTANTNVNGGNGGIGGGGGCGQASNAGYQTGWGGKGGQGLILIQYLPW